MKIELFGKGKMGSLIAQLAKEQGYQIVSENADVYVDFSHADCVLENLRKACSANIPIIIGTTGWEEKIPDAKWLVENSDIGCMYAPNFSIGVALFYRLLKKARSLFSEYEAAGIEYHHNQKKDAPSGTAKMLAKMLEIPPFSSVRCGSMIGKHQVVFDAPFDSVTVTHEGKDRKGYALGALRAAKWICNQKGWFTIDDMLDSFNHAL